MVDGTLGAQLREARQDICKYIPADAFAILATAKLVWRSILREGKLIAWRELPPRLRGLIDPIFLCDITERIERALGAKSEHLTWIPRTEMKYCGDIELEKATRIQIYAGQISAAMQRYNPVLDVIRPKRMGRWAEAVATDMDENFVSIKAAVRAMRALGYEDAQPSNIRSAIARANAGKDAVRYGRRWRSLGIRTPIRERNAIGLIDPATGTPFPSIRAAARAKKSCCRAVMRLVDEGELAIDSSVLIHPAFDQLSLFKAAKRPRIPVRKKMARKFSQTAYHQPAKSK